MRPSILHVGNILRWTILTSNPDTGVLKDADATPTVTIRKNGAAPSGATATVTKRASTTGIYDVTYDPTGEVETDQFQVAESVLISGTATAQATYDYSWVATAVSVIPTVAQISAKIATDIDNEEGSWADALGRITDSTAGATSTKIAAEIIDWAAETSNWLTAVPVLTTAISQKIGTDIIEYAGDTTSWLDAVPTLASAISGVIAGNIAADSNGWEDAAVTLGVATSFRITDGITNGTQDWDVAMPILASVVKVGIGLAAANLDAQLSDIYNATTILPTASQIATVVDSTLLNAGDATDLIASIVTRIGNTNVDQAAFVAAVKAALFDTGSAANKLAVDSSGRVTVGSNADKTGYSLTTAPLDAAGVRAAVGMSSANLDGQLTNLPSAVWAAATRTLTSATDSSGITTLLTRAPGLLQTKAQADVDQTEILDAINQVLGGDFEYTITVTNAEDDSPIEGAKVRLYHDVHGSGSQDTNGDGEAGPFGLQAATWHYVVTSGANYYPVTGSFDVSANGQRTIQLTRRVVPVPDDPALATLSVLCLNRYGAPEPGVVIKSKMTVVPSGSTGAAYDGDVQYITSNADGIATLTVVRLATYMIRRGNSSAWQTVVIANEASTEVTSFVGSP